MGHILTGKRLLRLGTLGLLVGLGLAPVSCYLGFNLDWGADVGERDGLASLTPRPAPILGAPQAAPPEPEDGDAAAAVSAARLAPTSAPVQPEDFDPEAWDAVVKRLQIEVVSFPGRVAVYLKDLKRDRVWTHQADDLFPSASLIKVPIMAAVFDKINRGELTLQDRLILRRRHRTGGSGSLKWSRDGSQYTVRQIIEKMIDESDNTATKLLIDTVGLGYLQQHFPKMGLFYTEIYPEGMSLQSSRVTYENYTTAREMASILERIYRGDLVDRNSSELMLNIMKQQKSRVRLAKALPPGWEIAHKTGLLRGACHDSAVIFTPQGDFILVVLTGQNRSYSRAKDFIVRLGRSTYRYWRGDQGLYARVPLPSRRSRRPGVVD